ncbi:hypothetical protein F6V30_07905 [Oryzomonas sagensis]|uniref:Uncharacterized protein n=1 Tax=Oryzomonas sagensis TaxID=2603857 RepID=A0ABQ6TNF4_9BACT|nr:hypothetical protein [Oryzomonas sagensis]KAB0670080.1 hypothetical protein F6V30_07905 [Oryzomonas sagensis]
MSNHDDLRELYMEICDLFYSKAPEVELPFYQRLIRCLEVCQYFVERTNGRITRVFWWWAIPSEDIPLSEDIQWNPENISTGDTAYIVNGYSEAGELSAQSLWDEFGESLFAACTQVASHFHTEGDHQ